MSQAQTITNAKHTPMPLIEATVVAIHLAPDPAADRRQEPRTLKSADLDIGTKVRFRYGSLEGKIGVVVGEEHCFARVVVEVAGERGGELHRIIVDAKAMNWADVVPATGPSPRSLIVGDRVTFIRTFHDESLRPPRLNKGDTRIVRDVDEYDYSGRCSVHASNRILNVRYEPPCPLELVTEHRRERSPRKTWRGGSATVLINGTSIDVALPPDKTLRVGYNVRLTVRSLRIVDVV